MLCVFTSELFQTLESVVDKFAQASVKTGEEAASKAASKWMKKTSMKEDNSEDGFGKYLKGLQNAVEEGSQIEFADFGVGDGHNGIGYTPGMDKVFVGVDEGRVANLACYFEGKLLAPAPTVGGPGGRRRSVEVDHSAVPNADKIRVRRHSFRQDKPKENEVDAQEVMEAYINVAMAHNVGGCHLAHKDLSNSASLEQHMHRLRGKFAFVMYDRQRKRVMAGRDPRGTVPLFWATDVEGLRLYFATNKEALSEHADRVREFPAGGLYVSKAAELAGTLNGHALTDPRYIWMPKEKKNNENQLQMGSFARRPSAGSSSGIAAPVA